MSFDKSLVKLGVDVFKKSTGEFSLEDSESTLRNALIELNGGNAKIDYRAMRRNKVAMFEAMEEILGTLIVEGIENQFADFVEIRNLAFGDTDFFMVDDYHLFPVATVSGGNGNMRRNRHDRTSFQVTTQWKGVKIYDELERFLAGRVDWAMLISKIQRSFNAQIAADIYNAITVAYGALAAPYLYSGSADRTQLNTLVNHIEAATDRAAMVYGTKLALQNFAPEFVATAGPTIEDRNEQGYFAVIDGIKFMMIRQAHTPGTDNFAIGDNFLLVVPTGEEKIVKMVIEGQPLIEETSAQQTMNADRSIEYSFMEKYGVGVVTSTKYGAYVL